MNKTMLSRLAAFFGVAIIMASIYGQIKYQDITGAPPNGTAENEVPQDLSVFDVVRNWVRPEGPAKVGLQVGHWKNDEVPDELERLKNNTGASGGGKMEWEVNYAIAQEISDILTQNGVLVEILPATVPPRYWADVFLAIHADGSTDRTKSGYKFAGPWRDLTGKGDDLIKLLEKNYDEQIGIERDENITRNMRGYYAFSWWKNEHAIHPMTTAVIAETGFLTNYSDQQMLINNPDKPARAIADAIIEYLQSENLL